MKKVRSSTRPASQNRQHNCQPYPSSPSVESALDLSCFLSSPFARAQSQHVKTKNSPTAAFRRFVKKMSASITNMLRADATICAMFEMDALLSPGSRWPALAIPHSGFTPTGAELVGCDSPNRDPSLSDLTSRKVEG